MTEHYRVSSLKCALMGAALLLTACVPVQPEHAVQKETIVVKPGLDRIYSHKLYMYRWSIDRAAKAEAER